MTKQEMIIELMNLYDENEKLKAENDHKVSDNFIDQSILDYGKSKILEECLYSWINVRYEYDEHSKMHYYAPFGKWVTGKISRVPDFMSKNEFLTYFAEELQAMYECEKQQALKLCAGDANEQNNA